MKQVFRTIVYLAAILCLPAFSLAEHSSTVASHVPHLEATPSPCISSAFSSVGGPSWYNISLKITNNCRVDVDFQNALISFNNADSLNTSFWGSFSPLSYPDNVLMITSSPHGAGGYLSSLNLHFPEASWANSKLKNNEFFIIKYGAPFATHDPATVKVYVGTTNPEFGAIRLNNASSRPATITQPYAPINIISNNQTTTVQLPWSGQLSLSQLALGTYFIQPLDMIDSQGATYQGVASPNSITVLANQTSGSVITYSRVARYGNINIAVAPLPIELAGFTSSPTVTLKRLDTGASVSQSIPWNSTTLVQGLDENISYHLSSSSISFNGYTCNGVFSPNPVVSRASSPPTTQLSYSCGKASGRIIAYVPGWKTPPSAASLAAAGYTHVSAAFGVFSTTNPGLIVNAFTSITKEYIDSLHESGIKVLLSLGGAQTSISGTSVDFHQVLSLASSPANFQSVFIDSVQTLATQFGFDGIDIDIEHGLIGSGSFSAPTGDIAVLAGILNTLRQNNPSFLISLTPQVANISATSGFDGVWGNYASLIMQTHQSLSFVGIQIYNTGCAYGIDHICYADLASSPDLSVAMATALLENWPQTDSTGRATGFQPYKSFLSPRQIVLGYPAPNRQGVSDGLPVKPTHVIKRAIQCLRTGQRASNSCDTYVPPRTYTPGGVFEWEATYDQDNNFQFATDLKACVLNGEC